MIRFSIPMPPGLHAKPDRATIVRAIQNALGGRYVAKQRYRTHLCLIGLWDGHDGLPIERNTDNVAKVLLDAMAEAFRFGKRGRGDQWLDRHLTIEAVHSTDVEMAEVTLYPV